MSDLLHWAGQGPALPLRRREETRTIYPINSSPNKMPHNNLGMKLVWLQCSPQTLSPQAGLSLPLPPPIMCRVRAATCSLCWWQHSYREKRLEEAGRVNYNLWPSLSVKLKSHVFILFPVIFSHRWRKPVSVNTRDVLGGSIPTHPRHKELY